jgi:hypothetical protein
MNSLLSKFLDHYPSVLDENWFHHPLPGQDTRRLILFKSSHMHFERDRDEHQYQRFHERWKEKLCGDHTHVLTNATTSTLWKAYESRGNIDEGLPMVGEERLEVIVSEDQSTYKWLTETLLSLLSLHPLDDEDFAQLLSDVDGLHENLEEKPRFIRMNATLHPGKPEAEAAADPINQDVLVDAQAEVNPLLFIPELNQPESNPAWRWPLEQYNAVNQMTRRIGDHNPALRGATECDDGAHVIMSADFRSRLPEGNSLVCHLKRPRHLDPLSHFLDDHPLEGGQIRLELSSDAAEPPAWLLSPTYMLSIVCETFVMRKQEAHITLMSQHGKWSGVKIPGDNLFPNNNGTLVPYNRQNGQLLAQINQLNHIQEHHKGKEFVALVLRPEPIEFLPWEKPEGEPALDQNPQLGFIVTCRRSQHKVQPMMTNTYQRISGERVRWNSTRWNIDSPPDFLAPHFEPRAVQCAPVFFAGEEVDVENLTCFHPTDILCSGLLRTQPRVPKEVCKGTLHFLLHRAQDDMNLLPLVAHLSAVRSMLSDGDLESFTNQLRSTFDALKTNYNDAEVHTIRRVLRRVNDDINMEGGDMSALIESLAGWEPSTDEELIESLLPKDGDEFEAAYGTLVDRGKPLGERWVYRSGKFERDSGQDPIHLYVDERTMNDLFGRNYSTRAVGWKVREETVVCVISDGRLYDKLLSSRLPTVCPPCGPQESTEWETIEEARPTKWNFARLLIGILHKTHQLVPIASELPEIEHVDLRPQDTNRRVSAGTDGWTLVWTKPPPHELRSRKKTSVCLVHDETGLDANKKDTLLTLMRHSFDIDALTSKLTNQEASFLHPRGREYLLKSFGIEEEHKAAFLAELEKIDGLDEDARSSFLNPWNPDDRNHNEENWNDLNLLRFDGLQDYLDQSRLGSSDAALDMFKLYRTALTNLLQSDGPAFEENEHHVVQRLQLKKKFTQHYLQALYPGDVRTQLSTEPLVEMPKTDDGRLDMKRGALFPERLRTSIGWSRRNRDDPFGERPIDAHLNRMTDFLGNRIFVTHGTARHMELGPSSMGALHPHEDVIFGRPGDDQNGTVFGDWLADMERDGFQRWNEPFDAREAMAFTGNVHRPDLRLHPFHLVMIAAFDAALRTVEDARSGHDEEE